MNHRNPVLLWLVLLLGRASAFALSGRSVTTTTTRPKLNDPAAALRGPPASGRLGIIMASAGSSASRRAHSLSSVPSFLEAPLSKVFSLMTVALEFLSRNIRELTDSQELLMVAIFILGFWLGRIRPFRRRLTDTQGVPSRYFGPRAPPLAGRAVAVSDGDTIRFLHAPAPWSPRRLRPSERASEVALPIRICTM